MGNYQKITVFSTKKCLNSPSPLDSMAQGKFDPSRVIKVLFYRETM